MIKRILSVFKSKLGVLQPLPPLVKPRDCKGRFIPISRYRQRAEAIRNGN